MTIEVSGLSHSYGGKEALHDVSFRVERGEVLGYLGPNGAGKSTTIRVLLGLLVPTNGTVRVAGCDVRTDPIGVRQAVGYLPEVAAHYEALTPLDHARLVGRLRGLSDETSERRVTAILAAFEIEDRLEDPLRGFSKGMRQKVGIALALFHDPAVLLLDEPLSGLDAQSTQILKELVRGLAKRGTAILYSSHVLDVVEKVCDRAVILNQGRVVAEGSITDLQNSTIESTLDAVFRRVVNRDREPAEIARTVIDEVGR